MAYSAALSAANDGLDYLSARGLADAAIIDAWDDCLVWWPTSTGVTMRINVVLTSVLAAWASVVATNSAGEVIAPPADPPAVSHPALRFIRISRTSDYLYDAYRNMFLALDALLSDIRPRLVKPDGRLEGEKIWFERALRAAGPVVPYAVLAPAGTRATMPWILHNLYGDERSGLMHAKGGQSFHLPASEGSRTQLARSLERLSQYVTKLAAEHLGVPRAGGGIFAGTSQLMVEGVLRTLRAAVSDDTAPIRADDGQFAPTGGGVVALAEVGPVQMVEPLVGTTISRCDPAVLKDLGVITRIGAIDEHGHGAVYSSLPGPLSVGPLVTSLEVMLGIRNVGAFGPRTHFSA